MVSCTETLPVRSLADREFVSQSFLQPLAQHSIQNFVHDGNYGYGLVVSAFLWIVFFENHNETLHKPFSRWRPQDISDDIVEDFKHGVTKRWGIHLQHF